MYGMLMPSTRLEVGRDLGLELSSIMSMRSITCYNGEKDELSC